MLDVFHISCWVVACLVSDPKACHVFLLFDFVSPSWQSKGVILQCFVLNANGLKAILFIGSALHSNGAADQWSCNITAFMFHIGCC